MRSLHKSFLIVFEDSTNQSAAYKTISTKYRVCNNQTYLQEILLVGKILFVQSFTAALVELISNQTTNPNLFNFLSTAEVC